MACKKTKTNSPPYGTISIGVPGSTAAQTASMSLLLRAMQPSVQSMCWVRKASQPRPFFWPWIMMAPPGGHAPLAGTGDIAGVGVGNVDGFIKGAVRFFVIQQIASFGGAFIPFALFVPARVGAEGDVERCDHFFVAQQIEPGLGFVDQHQVGFFRRRDRCGTENRQRQNQKPYAHRFHPIAVCLTAQQARLASACRLRAAESQSAAGRPAPNRDLRKHPRENGRRCRHR